MNVIDILIQRLKLSRIKSKEVKRIVISQFDWSRVFWEIFPECTHFSLISSFKSVCKSRILLKSSRRFDLNKLSRKNTLYSMSLKMRLTSTAVRHRMIIIGGGSCECQGADSSKKCSKSLNSNYRLNGFLIFYIIYCLVYSVYSLLNFFNIWNLIIKWTSELCDIFEIPNLYAKLNNIPICEWICWSVIIDTQNGAKVSDSSDSYR